MEGFRCRRAYGELMVWYEDAVDICVNCVLGSECAVLCLWSIVLEDSSGLIKV